MPRTRAPSPVPTSPPARVPTSGKGGHEVRGSAAQRRAFYESFRAHTDEARERLMGIIRNVESDDGHVIQAAKEVLARGWGGVPQVQVIEAALKVDHGVSRDALRGMPQADLQKLEALLSRLVEVRDAEVIEGTPVTESGED